MGDAEKHDHLSHGLHNEAIEAMIISCVTILFAFIIRESGDKAISSSSSFADHFSSNCRDIYADELYPHTILNSWGSKQEISFEGASITFTEIADETSKFFHYPSSLQPFCQTKVFWCWTRDPVRYLTGTCGHPVNMTQHGSLRLSLCDKRLASHGMHSWDCPSVTRGWPSKACIDLPVLVDLHHVASPMIAVSFNLWTRF